MVRYYLLVVCALLFTLEIAGARWQVTYYFTALSSVGSYTTVSPYAFNTVNGQFEVVGKTGGAIPPPTAATRPSGRARPREAPSPAQTSLSNIPGASTGDRVSGVNAGGDLAGYSRGSNNKSFSWFLPSGGTGYASCPR